MGVSAIVTRCKDCEEEFDIVLEWHNKESAIEEIKKAKCPKCGSENWYMTDSMGQ